MMPSGRKYIKRLAQLLGQRTQSPDPHKLPADYDRIFQEHATELLEGKVQPDPRDERIAELEALVANQRAVIGDHVHAAQERDQLRAELNILKNPSDGRCMEIAVLRKRRDDLTKERDQLREALGNALKVMRASRQAMPLLLPGAIAIAEEALAAHSPVASASTPKEGESKQ